MWRRVAAGGSQSSLSHGNSPLLKGTGHRDNVSHQAGMPQGIPSLRYWGVGRLLLLPHPWATRCHPCPLGGGGPDQPPIPLVLPGLGLWVNEPGVAPHATCSPWPCAFLQPGRVCVGALGAPGAAMCPPGLIPHCQKARFHGEGQPRCCRGALIPGHAGRHMGLGIMLSQPAPAPVSSVPKASLAGME